MSDISKKLNSIENLAKETERIAKNLQENQFSEFDRIIKDIQEQKENAMAMEFTKCIRELLKKNGVVPKITEYTRENVRENSIEHRYGVSIDGLDFTEHDKGFKDEIERLKRQIEKLASIRTRCHESARDSFDSGNYGCLHIVTTDELKNSNEKVLKLESELFDVQKSADEYYNRCIDLTNQIAKLESELEVKDNLMKIKNGLLGNNDDLPDDPIEVAQMLINATFEYEASNLEKALFKCDDTRTTERYSIDDLEQIAEHLLVYCKHNREDDE